MLAELGCELVEIGHSERRRLYGETDAKIRAGVRHGDQADGVGFVLDQARQALSAIPQHSHTQCLFAYEPVDAMEREPIRG